jgi:hypothetical protein
MFHQLNALLSEELGSRILKSGIIYKWAHALLECSSDQEAGITHNKRGSIVNHILHYYIDSADRQYCV